LVFQEEEDNDNDAEMVVLPTIEENMRQVQEYGSAGLIQNRKEEEIGNRRH
jgi:hypothetical protein